VGQITKIAVAPAVLGIEYVLFRKTASLRVMASIALVCMGVAAATVTDERVGTSGLGGLLVGAGAVGATALYQVSIARLCVLYAPTDEHDSEHVRSLHCCAVQIWAGSKQNELGAGSMQLLHQYSPLAALMLAGMVVSLEPIGMIKRGPDTLLGESQALQCCPQFTLT